MRVSADNHIELSRCGIEIQLRKIVKYVYLGQTCLRHCSQRQLGRPRALIDVPSNGDHGRQGAALIDDLGFAHIPGMDDEIGTSQGD
jgi:hypothetical protein